MIRHFLKNIFQRSIEPPFKIGKALDAELPALQGSFEENDYVLITDFFHKTLLPRMEAAKGAPHNLIASLFASQIMNQLCEGQTSFFYPSQLKDDEGHKILFAYDCYVPVHFLCSDAKSKLKMASLFKKDLDNTTLRVMTESYLSALSEMKQHVVKEDSLHKSGYRFFNKGNGNPPFFRSIVERGNSFDFVMRPKQG